MKISLNTFYQLYKSYNVADTPQHTVVFRENT